MILSKILKNTFLVLLFGLVVTACATKKTTTDTAKIDSQIQGDVYVGSDTVGELAKGVPDRVFFATNESILTTKSRDTLRKQAAWLRENTNVNVVIEGHADERGTREYNLALGERRAFSVKSFLVSLGIEESRISVISYGKEKPQSLNDNEASWAQNRTAITVINQ